MTDVSDDAAPALTHLTTEQLAAGVDDVRRSPADLGTLELIVVRPTHGERQVRTVARLDETLGLEGDKLVGPGSRHTDDGRPSPSPSSTS